MGLKHDDITWLISQRIYIFWLDNYWYMLPIYVDSNWNNENFKKGYEIFIRAFIEVQHCKSSNMEFEIWESRCSC